MFELIALIIFLVSLAGVIFIVARKVPALSILPQNGTTGLRRGSMFVKAGESVKEFFIFFEKQIFLHKLLSWIKVITLKVETKVDQRLHSIRKNAQRENKNIKK